ncbi:MAG: DUF3189 family protein [Bacillota bacterium]
MIIYHSREALTARLAGLLHVGSLGPRPDPVGAWPAVGAPEAYGAEGLFHLGADEQGHQVYAAGRASRPDVVDRVLHGLAELFAIDPASYLLVAVGPGHALADQPAVTLRRLGLGTLAARLEIHLLARRWPACLAAVERARRRVAERSGAARRA